MLPECCFHTNWDSIPVQLLIKCWPIACWDTPPLWTEWLTDRCKNITFANFLCGWSILWICISAILSMLQCYNKEPRVPVEAPWSQELRTGKHTSPEIIVVSIQIDTYTISPIVDGSWLSPRNILKNSNIEQRCFCTFDVKRKTFSCWIFITHDISLVWCLVDPKLLSIWIIC